MASPRFHLLWECLVAPLDGEGRDAPAVQLRDRTLSYAELSRVVARGARELADLPPASRVLIASRNQARVALGFLSVLAAGRVPLLADPTDVTRLRDIAERFGAVAFIDDDLGAALGLPWRSVAAAERWLDDGSGRALEPPAVEPRDEAFWVFTSGSTGAPRPVVHAHRAPLAAFEGFGRGVLSLRPSDVTVATAGLPFVYALGNNLLFPLLAGASCVLTEDCLLPTVLGALVRHRATILVAGPWSLEALARLATRPDRAEALGALRVTLSAGEPLPASVFEEWRRRFGHPPIDNLGCTETFNSFISNRPGDAVSGTLGRVVPGYEIRVGSSEAVPGAQGALRVRGESRALAVGTDEVESRSFHSPSEWHDTGDEVCVDPGGRIVFLGRRDHRFKVKGRFVHPLEVERRLLEVPGVRECIVVPESGRGGLALVGARLVAEAGVDEGDLVRRVLLHARRNLPACEIPRRITVVPELSRNARGKLARPLVEAGARGDAGR